MNGASPQHGMPSDAHMPARPGAAPFWLDGGEIGVLMLHGYSGVPGELRGMAESLAARGYTVHAPLLAGHGGPPSLLADVTWRDWLRSAEEGLAALRARCSKLAVVGFSMGGLAGIHLAAHAELACLVLLAPALRLRGQWVVQLTGAIKHVKRWYYPLAKANFADPAVRENVRLFAPDANLDDPATVAYIRQAARVPIGSLYELVHMQRQARRDLPRVRVPTLVMQGRNDRTVDPASSVAVVERLGAPRKQLLWFERSDHQLPEEAEREAVWRAGAEWIASSSSVEF